MKMKLTILGTGNAKVTKCYNTCFTLNEDKELYLDPEQYPQARS